PPKIYAYQVTSTIEVRTTDLEKMGGIIANAIESGATNISSIGFDLTESLKQKAVNDALTAATNDAGAKAKTIADSMGLTIDRVYAINESGTSFPEPFRAAMKAAPEGMGGDVSAPEILPQEIEISASVGIVYLFTE
ncbi:MAG: SIMPL domain-containing protein, partial [Bacteroidetes bacterium]|nr:SIMPL domain-containing protein [Bacteroidota bacterium]